MIKTKGMEAGKVGNNYPAGATLTGTEKTRAGGQMPGTAALPTMADQDPWLTAAPASVGRPDAGQTAESLPLFSATAGFTDTGAQSTGDLGGAA